MLKKSVKDYFDQEDQEEESFTVSIPLKKMNTINFVGRVVRGWKVVEVIDQRVGIYRIICPCGKEFVRKIYVIINGRVTQCRFCYRKSTNFPSL